MPVRSRKTQLLDRIVQNRFRGKNLSNLFQQYEKETARKRLQPGQVLKGIHRGQYFRVKVPPKPTILPEVPKIPSPTGPLAPKAFKPVPPAAGSASSNASTAASTTSTAITTASTSATANASQVVGNTARHTKDNFQQFFERLKAWWKENWAVLIMNAGSLCTLAAFTRSDVLELRSLSVSGSVCFIIYTLSQTPIKWLTIGWTSLFASVNTFKIVQIVNERHSHVQMTDEQEECFVKFFMPHGITPKQYEFIERKAQRVVIKKGDAIIRQGDELDSVYLVIQGSTRASILGRYLTAASAAPAASNETREGGNAGAWIGEQNFLESYWDLEQGKTSKDDEGNASADNKNDTTTTHRSIHAMYTVVAKEDCVVWKWSYDDMGQLMEKSTDMRAALTRAMTAAIVGKVINFTVSRTSQRPTWQTWLDDWKHTRVRVGDDDDDTISEDAKANPSPRKKTTTTRDNAPQGSPDEGQTSPA